ncbi:MAG: twin-arginine translocation signal domain-containing protein [Bacteroidales bacterium]|nr:twin-arginine translocation signal domain-containing protein [Bacteroidales bacterium]
MSKNRDISRRSFLKNSAGATAVTMIPGIFPFSMAAKNEKPENPAAPSEEQKFMRTGFAEIDITPEIGMEQVSNYGKQFHKSFHDPCKVRAAVFDDGKNRAAVVGIDALVVPRFLVLKVRNQVEARCGIPGDAILIGASHSHSSGPIGLIYEGDYDHADKLVQTLAYEKSSGGNPKYLAMVEKSLVDVICRADDSREESRLGVGTGIEDEVAFNRRFRMKNGMTITHPGQGNPDIIEPAGPTDPEIGVIGSWNKDGKCIGCIVNFACHATASPGGISANWIYYMEQTIRGAMGQDCIVVFTAGANGDVTQVDNLSPYKNPAGEDWSRFVGAQVGAEAVKVLLSVPRGIMAPVESKIKVMNIPRRKPDPERVKKCYEIVKKSPEEVGSTEWTFAKELVLLDALIKKEPVVELEVQAVQIGPAVFVSNPAEYFCQFGLNIKQGSPFNYTFPVELANGCVGYVPTQEAFGPGGGGYETRLTSYSNLEIDAGDKMADAGIELTKQMNPGPEPQFEKAPSFSGKPWEYGNVKPELK